MDSVDVFVATAVLMSEKVRHLKLRSTTARAVS